MIEKASWSVGRRRLLKLVALLQELPRKRFDYCLFVGSDWKGKKDLSCGTTACALGWATTIPSLRRLGLSLTHHGGVALFGFGFGENWSESFEVGEIVFGLSDICESRFLFSPHESQAFYPRMFDWKSPSEEATPKQVAKHILRFIRKKDQLLKK